MRESILVPPQEWYDATFDRIDQSSLTFYSVDVIQNEIRVVINDGFLLAYGFDRNITIDDISGNWVYADFYDANNIKVARYDDFSYYVSSVDGLNGAGVRFGAADIESYLTNQDDWFDFDPAGDDLDEFLAEQASGEQSGQVIFVDGQSGIDTIASNIWSSDDFNFQRNASGNYFATFIPTGQTIELRNFEKIDLADTPELTIEEALGATSSENTDPQNVVTLIADVLGSVMLLKNLNEVITETSHTIEYGGTIFDYEEVDGMITTVIRNGEFTDEFSREIEAAYPNSRGITYNTAVTLVGQSNIDATLLAVAGADGNYVG